MHTMNKKASIEWNRVFHLEDSMIMYGVYNVDTLEKLIQMVHKMNTRSVWFEWLYAGNANKWFETYLVKVLIIMQYIHCYTWEQFKKNILKCMKDLSTN